jgi:hypothetical protein
MVWIGCIILGVCLFFLGNFVWDEYDDEPKLTWGMSLMILGIAFIVLGLVMTAPMNVKAEEKTNTYMVQGAGVTAHMNALRYAYMNEPELLTEESEIDLLARLMTAEQGYNADEMDYYLTGSVIINRVNSPNFPNTVYEVIFQSNPRQYQCVINGHINREYDEVAWEVAEELLTEGTQLNEHIVYQAEFEQGKGVYTKRGRTYYCYQ